MNHIKLFENYSKYFEEISVYNYTSESISLGNEDLNDTEISYIKSLLPNPNILVNSYGKFWRTAMVFRSENSINIYINKHKDEWFLIEFWDRKNDTAALNEHIYYKCDQFEGLKQCLGIIL